MKLNRVTPKENVTRLAVSIKQSSHDMLEAYREQYKAVYGQEIEMSALVETMLKEFMTSDKDFMKKFAAASKG